VVQVQRLPLLTVVASTAALRLSRTPAEESAELANGAEEGETAERAESAELAERAETAKTAGSAELADGAETAKTAESAELADGAEEGETAEQAEFAAELLEQAEPAVDELEELEEPAEVSTPLKSAQLAESAQPAEQAAALAAVAAEFERALLARAALAVGRRGTVLQHIRALAPRVPTAALPEGRTFAARDAAWVGLLSQLLFPEGSAAL
jgi:hypothetical protein